MKKLWKFEWYDDYAFIGGIFKATNKEVESLIGKEVCFGEVAGKHSEVYGIIEGCDIALISENPIIVDGMIEFGYNPLEYVCDD